MEFHGISGNSMDFHAFHGTLSILHGVTPLKSMELPGIPWNSMELHEYSIDTPLNSMEVPWNSMEVFHTGT